MSEGSRKLSRFTSEFIVIVLGVLVALGIEAAWEFREDRDLEVVLIRDLAQEFSANRERLAADLARNRLALAAAEEWRDAQDRIPAISPDSAAALLQASNVIWRFDPLTGVLQSVLETGQLSLIRELALRQALAGWLGRVAEVTKTSLEASTNRTALVPELLNVVEGRGSSTRRREILNLHTRLGAYAPAQQNPLLGELDRILGLLASESG